MTSQIAAPWYTVECPRCEDGDLGGTDTWTEARERAHRHEDRSGHTVRIYENGIAA
ncbi:hypothetical protein JOE61_000900 [Nocardioides salarius]|uniref:Uncharacterized protein n=1 Tax=Nocardioides salarius TaxID=374513 RepID=A0ABS2M7B9_9ACTN|nr:hypothetical protein [Nocardioides salarius]MBM7507086.1 hypothetical protein [Nocardioides salarius]